MQKTSAETVRQTTRLIISKDCHLRWPTDDLVFQQLVRFIFSSSLVYKGKCTLLLCSTFSCYFCTCYFYYLHTYIHDGIYLRNLPNQRLHKKVLYFFKLPVREQTRDLSDFHFLSRVSFPGTNGSRVVLFLSQYFSLVPTLTLVICGCRYIMYEKGISYE
jgi:hypothetical protein